MTELDPYRPWLTVALLLAGAVAAWLCRPKTSGVPSARAGFALRNEAYLDPSFIPSFDARTRRRQWLWAFYPLSLSAGLVLILWTTYLPPALVWAPILAVLTTVESIDRLRDAGREFVVPDHRSAVARPRRVVLSDYVPVRAQVLTWASVTIMVISTVAVLAHHATISGSARVIVAVSAGTILATAVFTAWLGRALCARPTPAVDPSHLYLQDAWRAGALERGHTQLRLNATMFTISVVLAPLEPLGLALGLNAAVAAMVIASIGLPQRHFRQRLWGTLAPGQVLLPGQPVPPRVGASA